MPPLYLASRSPRRRRLLADAGIAHEPIDAAVDDSDLQPPPGLSASAWTMALAYLKARSALEVLEQRSDRSACAVILAADTVCALPGGIFGQPVNAADARSMLRAMRGGDHCTITGVCLLTVDASGVTGRFITHDVAVVTLGEVTDEQIADYLASQQWRGKAGAYNLVERLDAGWAIECAGDPTTVMGLPMRKLQGWLNTHGC